LADGMPDRRHIIVCDDEPDFRDLVSEYLERNGFAVSAVGDGAQLRHVLETETPAAVVLDLGLPGEDGLSLARHIRQGRDIGIIILTGSGDVVDRVVGLEMGADDYVGKPVDLRELLARLRAVLRRTATAARATAGNDGDGRELLSFGDGQIDVRAHKLFNRDGVEIAVTAMEFRLIQVFCEHPDRILTRDQLLELAHDRSWDPFDRSIDIRISRLRKKVEVDPTKPQYIRTVRGSGYIYSRTRQPIS
jgi:two-component system phosphate regulon response regulator OmpR